MDFTKAVPLRALLDSSTQQLAASAKTTDRLQLTGATITVRGLPSGSGSDFSLSFPRPIWPGTSTGCPSCRSRCAPTSRGSRARRPCRSRAGPAAPIVTGYTRDLAVRKLAAAGHAVRSRAKW